MWCVFVYVWWHVQGFHALVALKHQFLLCGHSTTKYCSIRYDKLLKRLSFSVRNYVILLWHINNTSNQSERSRQTRKMYSKNKVNSDFFRQNVQKWEKSFYLGHACTEEHRIDFHIFLNFHKENVSIRKTVDLSCVAIDKNRSNNSIVAQKSRFFTQYLIKNMQKSSVADC